MNMVTNYHHFVFKLGCKMCLPWKHKWKIIESVKYEEWEGKKDNVSFVGVKHTLQCEFCGDLKKKII